MKKTEEVRGGLGKTDSERCFRPLVVGMWYLTSSSPFISCPRRQPLGKSASHTGSRDSYSHSVQGFHSKISPHFAQRSHV